MHLISNLFLPLSLSYVPNFQLSTQLTASIHGWSIQESIKNKIEIQLKGKTCIKLKKTQNLITPTSVASPP